MTIRISPASPEEMLSDDIALRLREFNFAHVGEYHYGNVGQHLPLKRVSLNARSPEGRIVGGIRAFVFLSVLRVEVLFVDGVARGQGIGARLLVDAEQWARRKGAKTVELETFEFQALHFYAKQGYKESGRTNNYAKGFYLATMTKAL
jgi:GNAT superfamily N-acetyltransferase